MSKIKILTLLVFMISATFVVPASAQEPQPPQKPWTNTVVEIHADLGSAVPGLVPGKYGYKVFNPGAIKTTPVQSINNEPQALLVVAASYRRAYTDVWGSWPGPFQNWIFTGSHNSDSDLFEDQIWADGYLKYKSQTGWRNSCSNRTSGTRATCNTSFSGWYATVYAETKSYYRKSGYVDTYFTTSDTY